MTRKQIEAIAIIHRNRRIALGLSLANERRMAAPDRPNYYERTNIPALKFHEKMLTFTMILGLLAVLLMFARR